MTTIDSPADDADDREPVVLLTGFEPFGGAARNPSADAVRALAEQWNGPAHLIADVLPVEFGTAGDLLVAAVIRHRPDVVIATGLAEGRDSVTPERLGINLDDARIPDNGGAQPIDRAIEQGGPAARWSTLPLRAIVDALDAAGIPAALSNSAGTYVCNHVLYRLQGATERMPATASGFVHLPATPETGLGPDLPTLPLDDLVQALRIVVETSVAAARGAAPQPAAPNTAE